MQINKQVIVIIILASLLFSAIGAALFFYKKNLQTQKAKNEQVTIYIAKDDIPRDTLLTIDHLAKTTIAKEYILNTPLTKDEILNKYTNENIYKHEIFLKQKLDTKIAKEEKKILDFKNSSYNMKFALFQNPNYALVQGEYINIISVYPKDGYDTKKSNEFEVEYVANNLKILGFIRDGRHESSSITKQTIKKVVDKKTVEVIEEVKSDEIILDINLDVLLKLTQNYNKGNQLWMVKISYDEDNVDEVKQNNQDKVENEIDIIDSNNEKTPIIKDPVIVNNPIKYKYRLYTSNVTILTKSAVIDYANDKNKEKSKIKNVEITVDSNKICSQVKDKFILGTVNSFYIRSSPSKESKTKSLLYKNIIIPYIEKQEDWYKTCDGRFVHESVVSEVTSSFIQSKLGKYE